MLLSTHEAEIFPRVEPVKRDKPKINRKQVEARVEINATNMGMSLGKQHHQVISFVLDFYEHCDDCRNARQLMNLLRSEFKEEGGQRMLYRLFPKGPLSTIHDLAELPGLRHQVDLGFGTSY